MKYQKPWPSPCIAETSCYGYPTDFIRAWWVTWESAWLQDSKQNPNERNSLMKFRCGHNLWDDPAPPKFKHSGNNYSWTATMENNWRSCSCKTCRFGVSEFHKRHTKGTKIINVRSPSVSPLRQNTFLSLCKKRMYGIVREKTSIADKLVTSEQNKVQVSSNSTSG